MDMRKIYQKNLAKPKETLEEHTENTLHNCQILKELGYLPDSKIEVWLEEACRYHDIGKINDEFQKRVRQSGKRFNSDREVGHNILSAYLVSYFLPQELVEKGENRHIINAILNHHHYADNYAVIVKQATLIQKILENINETQLGIPQEDFARQVQSAIGDRALGKMKLTQTDSQYILLKGLLTKCDYAASAHLPCELANDFMDASLDSLGYQFNAMQQFCREQREQDLIVIASTGMGKTEASLLWAGDAKTYYVLPLRTAINAMYERFTSMVREKVEDRIGLLHGETKEVYLDQRKYDLIAAENDKFLQYYQRTRNLSLPVILSTPDQLFNFVFKYRGYELKLASFSYAKMIIDEIQAYSPDILAYTITALQWIQKLGGQFAIFTATLAPFVKDLLLEHTDTSSIAEATYLSTAKRHHVKVIEDSISAQAVQKVLEREDAVHTALVVVNTVRQSQELYKELKDLLDEEDYEINLLHAKFMQQDRRQKEQKILQDGQAIKREGRKKVWITTQIVEASLDIDFDMLFTELSELQGLFQRMGRCYRKRELEEERYNVYVYLDIDPKFTKGKYRFIDHGLYSLSREALLAKGDGWMTEKDKQNLINQYLTTENLKEQRDSTFFDEYKSKIEDLDAMYIGEKSQLEVAGLFRNIVSFKSIPASVYYNNPEIVAIKERIIKLEESIRNLTSENTEKSAREMQRLTVDMIQARNQLNRFTLGTEHYVIKDGEQVEIGKETIWIIGERFRYDSEIGLILQKQEDEESIML